MPKRQRIDHSEDGEDFGVPQESAEPVALASDAPSENMDTSGGTYAGDETSPADEAVPVPSGSAVGAKYDTKSERDDKLLVFDECETLV